MPKFKIEFKWAIIFTVMVLFWMVAEKLSGLHDKHIALHPIFTNFIAIPAIAIYVFALREKRQKNFEGIMSYKQGFVSGLVMTLIITVVAPLSQYITSVFITPDYFQNAINYTVSTKQSTLEDAQANFNLNNYLVQSAIGALVMGLMTTAVVAFFVRKKSR